MRSHFVLAASLTTACIASTDGPSTEDPTPIEILISQPGSGDTLLDGTTHRIEWEPPPGVETVNIMASGATTLTIATDVPNNGSYDWTISIDPTVDLDGLQTIGAYNLFVFPSGQPTWGDGQPFQIGVLGGLRWNGQAEEYTWIDPTSGEHRVVGTVGDLVTLPWPRPAAADPVTGKLYVIGFNATDTLKLYTLDARTGALDGQVTLGRYVGIGDPATLVAHDGKVYAFRYSEISAKEEIYRLDPASGIETLHGTLADLKLWTAQTAVHAATGRMFVVGVDASNLGKIYTVDLASGSVLDQAPTTLGGQAIDNLGGLNVNAAGELSAFRWDDVLHAEQFVRLDPHSGAASALGAVGDLQTWSFAAARNPTTDDVYAFGHDGTRDKLYVLDATSGLVTSVQTMTSTPTTALLVTRD